MKKIAQITLIGLLAVMVLLTGCANNDTARNNRNNDGLFDNGNDVANNNRNDWDDNIMGYDGNNNNNNNNLDLIPGDENVYDGDLNDRENNVRRGITTQLPRTTLPRTTTGTTGTGTTTQNRMTNPDDYYGTQYNQATRTNR